MGDVLMTAPKDWPHPARLRLPLMITGRVIQTVSPGKQVRGSTQRHLPTQQLLVRFQPRGFASSSLTNKSKVLWMIGEWQRPGKLPLLINISSWNFGPQMYRTCPSLSAETTKPGTFNTVQNPSVATFFFFFFYCQLDKCFHQQGNLCLLCCQCATQGNWSRRTQNVGRIYSMKKKSNNIPI